MERMSEIYPIKALLMLMTSLITSQRDVKVRWIQEMDTDSAYMSKSQYMQSYWFSNKSNINIIYNISVMTITITIIIILANFGKYAISDCLFSLLLAKIWFWQVCSLVVFVTCQNLILASMFVGHVCLFVCVFVCLYGNFTKSQERLSQSSPNFVASKH